MTKLLPPLPLVEGPVSGFYRVDSWEGIDTSHFTWCVNGCLFTTITQLEMVESYLQGDAQDVILYKLMPLVFLSMPVHDAPIIIHRGKPVV